MIIINNFQNKNNDYNNKQSIQDYICHFKIHDFPYFMKSDNP